MLGFAGLIWTVRSNELAFDDLTQYRPVNLEDQIADGSADGRRVEVQGRFSGGLLLVERIKVEDDNLEIKGVFESVEPVNAATAGLITVSFSPAIGTVAVVVDANTMFLNDNSLNPFNLSDLNPGTSFVEIKAHIDDAGNVVAGALELEDSLEEYEIEGPLDANGFSPGSSISVLGVEFFVDANTLYEDGLPSGGDVVDIEDSNRDGTAESVHIED
jgi:hypothetical protein